MSKTETTLSPFDHLMQLAGEADLAALENFFESDEAKTLTYAQKNAPFITGSKLQAFKRCPFCYKKKFIELLPDPTEGDKDYFIIGQALDDLLTHGDDAFLQKYEVVAKRGESEKIQLTKAMAGTVGLMAGEFKENPLFSKVAPKKKIMFHPWGKFLIKIEMDDFDGKNLVIRDLKSCANIKNFDPSFYITQATLYHWVVEENTGNRFKVEYEVMDKNTSFSRSRLVTYNETTLLAHRGTLLQQLEELMDAHDTDMFFATKDQDTLWDCPYYGVDGHGRPTAPLFY